MPHKVDSNLSYVYFYRFDISISKLKKVKIKLEIPALDPGESIPYVLAQEYYPFGTPYLFVLLQ